MVDDDALCVESARCGTGINALLVLASELGGTLGAGEALGSASWWATYVVAPAGANRLSVNGSALAIGSAGRRAAGRGIFRGWRAKIY